MNIVSAVANLQKERDYYKDAVKQCQEVIKQLTEGPGEVELIHPYDFAELLQSFDSPVDVNFAVGRTDIAVITETGKKYKQTPYIPARSKKFR